MRRISSTVAWVSATLMPGGRLVEAEELRLRRQRDADLEVALLAVREVRRRARPPCRRAPPTPARRGRASMTSANDAVVAQEAPGVLARLGGDPHVLEHGGAGQDVGDLVRARDGLRGDRVGRQPGDVLAVEHDAAARRAEHAGQAVEEGGLAGAVGADDARISPRGTATDTLLSAARPPNRTVRPSVLRMTRGRGAPAVAGRGLRQTEAALATLRELARRRGRRVFSLGIDSRILCLPLAELEDELAQEGLVVLLAAGSCPPAGSRRSPSSPCPRAPRSSFIVSSRPRNPDFCMPSLRTFTPSKFDWT